MKQEELIESLTSNQLKESVYYTQLLIFTISVSMILLFMSLNNFISLFVFDLKEFTYYGLIPALAVVLINLILDWAVPAEYLDDGGINEKLFEGQSVKSIFFIALTVSISEEILFRGILQTHFGLIIASIVFALIHVRYLRKPILFISVLLLSFGLGYLFLVTSNLLVTIIAHFTIDFLLGLIIKFRARGEQVE